MPYIMILRRKVIELIDKMIYYGLAKNKVQAFNIIIEKGLDSILKEIEILDKGKA